MSDETLRALERATREQPEDVAAGHALARALARAGEARREYLEWARLARRGDALARDHVLWWTGSLGCLGRLASPEKMTVRVRAPIDPTVRRLAGGTRAFLVLEAAEAAYLVDPVSLEEVVAIAGPDEEGRVAAAPCGDHVLVGRGRWLALHDPHGRVMARKELAGRIVSISVLGDRAVVSSIRGSDVTQIFVPDAGEDFGKVLFTRVIDDRRGEWIRFIGDELIHEGVLSLGSSVLDTTAGEALADVPPGVIDASRGRLLVGAHRVLSEHESSTGQALWENRDEGRTGAPVGAFVSEGLVLVSWKSARFGESGPLDRLATHERTGGLEVWGRDVEPRQEVFVVGAMVLTLALRPHLSVALVELATGREVGRVEVPALAPDSRSWAHGAALVPGALVALTFEGTEPRLARIE